MLLPKIKTTGVEDALREADERLAALHEGINADLTQFGEVTTEQMIATHTFQNRTFRLETSIGFKLYPLLVEGRFAQLQVYALADYASQVEEGHPGPPAARPYPFFWPVFWSYEPQLWERLQATLERTLNGGRAAA